VSPKTRFGLVLSPAARPGGNATGINFFTLEVVTKRLRLLHDLVPKAVRIAVLVNPANAASAEATFQAIFFVHSMWREADAALQRRPRGRSHLEQGGG